MPTQPLAPESFSSFGDLLRYLRRRARLTQLELSILVDYSEAQIGRLEQNQRRPDLNAVKALFIPALRLEEDPACVDRLLELARQARQEDAPSPGIAPYKGLPYFDVSDSELFFGREELTAMLVSRVGVVAKDPGLRFLAIVGASGSGKSSLVRAGLAVALKRLGWEVWIFTPTSEPVKVLAAQVDSERLASLTRPTLLVVDQFEEVFTLNHDESQQSQFADRLLALAAGTLPGGAGSLVVVIALRADFYARCAQMPQLRQALAAQQEYIGQMTVEELRRAIEEPARRGGWQMEPGLTEVLLRDIGAEGEVAAEPGALPLLSHALLATWERRRGSMLTRDGYHASGGVRGAIAETAESVFADQLNRPQQELARDIFLRLTELGEGTEDTRRRATLRELSPRAEDAANLRAVLNTLAGARLISLNEDTAEVAHEALIRKWQRLHGWLTEDREGLLLHRHLTDSAREWEQRGRDVGELYRGARLAQAREWAAKHAERLNPLERRFLDGSIQQEHHDALEREAQRQREVEAARQLAEVQTARAEEERRSADRLRLRNRIITFISVTTLVLADIAVVFALEARQSTVRAQSAEAQAVSQRDIADQQRSAALSAQATSQAEQSQADQERQLAVSRGLAVAALDNLNVDPERSVLLSLYALSQAQTKEAEEALHESVLNLRDGPRLVGHTDRIFGLAFSPDGSHIASSAWENTARVWDATTGQSLLTLSGHTDVIVAIAYSPDGRRIITGSYDNTAKIWDAQTGSLLLTLSGHTDGIQTVAFSPDGKRVVTAGSDKSARIWDAASGKELLRLTGHTDTIWMVALNRDGTRLATASGDRTTRVWDSSTGRQLLEIPGADLALAVAYSPDGARLVIGYGNGTVKVCDAETGQVLLNWSAHTGVVTHVAFNPDGTQIASAGSDGQARLWDAATGQPLLTLGGVWDGALAFSPDGRRLATAMPDNTGRIWDISPIGSHEMLTVDTGGAGILRNVGYSPDGKRFVTCSFDGKVQVRDAQTGAELLRLPGHTGIVYSCLYSPDGTRIATSGADGTERLWDATTGKELLRLTGHGGGAVGQFFPGVMGIAFSPDGKRLATAGADGVGKVWDAATGRELLALPSSDGVPLTNIAFSPDGMLLATSTDGDATGVVRIWDATTGKLLHAVGGNAVNRTWDLAFSPDGKRLATTGLDGITKIWAVSTGKALVSTPLHLGTESTSVAFSPDGTQIATSGNDGNINVWDAASGQAVLNLHISSGVLWGLTFSPDGSRLLVTTGRTATLFALRIDELIALARARVARTLTTEECQRYLQLETCPSGP